MTDTTRRVAHALLSVSDKTGLIEFANALAARGLGKGDRLAVFLSQSAELTICHLAGYRMGAVVLPLSLRGAAYQIAVGALGGAGGNLMTG